MSKSSGRLDAIHVSRGGVPKLSVFEALIGTHGLAGDVQRDSRHHGGPDRAVILYSMDLIRALQAEGHPIAPGSIGENLTIAGLDWTTLTRGTLVRVGSVELQLTKPTVPCRNISSSFLASNFMRISHEEHPGWSRWCARVLTGGIVRPGETVVASAPSAPPD